MSLAKRLYWKGFDSTVKNSNVFSFLRANRIRDFESLVKRSQKNIEWFWDAVNDFLGIEWYTPYKKVLDTRRGIEWPRWFVNGKINITHNCVDKHISTFRRHKLALLWEGENYEVRKLTYLDLYHEVNKLAQALLDTGIKEGEAVGVYMPMLPETAIALLAIAKIGAIFIPIFSGYGPDAVASRLNDASARLLITTDGFYRKGSIVEMKKIADSAVAMSPSVKRIVVFKRLGIDIPWNKDKDIYWNDFVKDKPTIVQTKKLSSETPWMIIYTSGTTGKPKGAVHVHGGFLVKQAEEIAFQVDLKDQDILFWFTDMGWIMGPWEVVGGLALGGTLFFYEGAPDWPKPDRLWDIIERHRITILGISPTAVRAFMRNGDQWHRAHDLSSLRMFGSTGEPWNPDPWMWLYKEVGKERCPIINLSGGTEVGACFLSVHPVKPLKPCSLGGPALGMDIDVFDENGKPIRNAVGELVCKKPWPSMTRGVWRDPGRYIETYWNRWKHVWVHGDWASIDKEGYWFLHGRSDDTIKVAGKRVGPAEVESVLVSHKAVTEAAAIGVPDELKGEVVVCFVVLKPGYEPSETLRNELIQLVGNALGKALTPKTVKFVADLPKTRNAKILRRFVKAKYLGQDITDTSSVENLSSLELIERAI
ncbi:MAG: acetate--CoA ligase [bacterium]